jgi:hypothetical protein
MFFSLLVYLANIHTRGVADLMADGAKRLAILNESWERICCCCHVTFMIILACVTFTESQLEMDKWPILFISVSFSRRDMCSQVTNVCQMYQSWERDLKQ